MHSILRLFVTTMTNLLLSVILEILTKPFLKMTKMHHGGHNNLWCWWWLQQSKANFFANGWYWPKAILGDDEEKMLTIMTIDDDNNKRYWQSLFDNNDKCDRNYKDDKLVTNMKMAYLAKCDKYNIATNILLRGGGIDQAWLDHKGRLMGTCLKPTPIGQFMVDDDDWWWY